MTVIETKQLSKFYGSFKAVYGLSIQAREGEIYGFLGLNGAGKTTTIRMLLGMIRPSSGNISLFGKDVKSNQGLWNEVGYMVETASANPDLTVKENLEIYFYYRKLKDKSDIDSIITDLNLGKYENVKARNLSLGNVQRLGLAKALMHRPRLLILDEPINGLDPSGIVEIRELLRKMTKNGTTIFLSSHILGEMAKVADRIGIIHEGKLAKEILSDDLGLELARSLTIGTDDNTWALSILSEKGYSAQLNADGLIHVRDQSAIDNPENISALIVESGLGLKQVFILEEDLESYFLRTIKTGSTQ